MGEIKVSVQDEKEEKFRKAAMDVFGHKRGSISRAAGKAMEEWADRVLREEVHRSQGLGSFLHGKLDSEKSAVEMQEGLGEAYEDEVLD
jgi:hypothetical protein